MVKSRRLHRLLHSRRTSPALAPGQVVPAPESLPPYVQVMAYDGNQLLERELSTPEEIAELVQLRSKYQVTWVSVCGVGSPDIIRQLGGIFDLHSLALEDAVSDHQRSKVELYGDYLFVVARMLEKGTQLSSDQLGLFLGENFVVTFQHQREDYFGSLRERIRRDGGIMRTSGADYLAYSILDGVIDSYFPICEEFGDYIETLEEEILANPDSRMITRIHAVKSKLLILRKTIWPLREALHVLARDPIALISEATRVYLRDSADHTFQIIDLTETYREMASNLMDLYHSTLANRTNEVMQLLTVIATIFIPLTFIVGVYGMNFRHMPELHWRYGYYFVWGIIIALGGGLVWYFQRRGWLPKRTVRQASRISSDT